MRDADWPRGKTDDDSFATSMTFHLEKLREEKFQFFGIFEFFIIKQGSMDWSSALWPLYDLKSLKTDPIVRTIGSF